MAELSTEARLFASTTAVTPEPERQARLALASIGPATSQAAKGAYLDEAADLDPQHPDVLRLLADRERSLAARLARIDDAIAAGLDRAGGVAAIAACRGSAWTEPRIRPYLRARGRRLELCIEAGRDAVAVAEGEALLALDGRDAMGLRYRLAGSYLLLGDAAGFRGLRMRFFSPIYS